MLCGNYFAKDLTAEATAFRSHTGVEVAPLMPTLLQSLTTGIQIKFIGNHIGIGVYLPACLKKHFTV